MWEGVNCLSFIDIKATWIMTIIHNVINKKLFIKSIEKRPGALKEIIIYNEEENRALSFPQVLDDYNQGMSDYNIYSYLISVYITARAY